MRLFYALMPSEAMIAALAPIQHGVSGARWQSAEQLHLTLRYVGDHVPTRVADELAAALPPRITLPPATFSGVGFFEAKGKPNALWTRVGPKEALTQLHHKLDRACQAAGLEPEGRAYLPHITLARMARSAGPADEWIARNAGFAAGPFPFARLSLVESVVTDEGSVYEEIASVRLE